jgi:hypothetical protein
MDRTLFCLVDRGGRIYVKEDAESYAEVAASFGLDERACQQYRFDFATRQLLVDRGDAEMEQSVRVYIDQYVGSPERLMTFAQQGALPKPALTDLLATDARPAYLAACAAIEKRYTEECAATKDPCLESGCALEDDICLEPLLKAGREYRKACAAAWSSLFATPDNRIDAWKN